MRNKHRIFVTFQHRNDRPGFHWSIMVAPKRENGDEKPTVYDATNTIAAGYESGQWRYRVRKDDLLSYGNFVARVLVAKISPAQAETIDSLMESAPVVQGDPSWTCVSWVKGALDVLRMSDEDSELSAIIDGDTVDKLGVAFAKSCLNVILERGHAHASLSDVPIKDLRGLSSS